MSKVGIIYWSSTGNTEAMAQAVEEGAKAAGADVEIMEVADADTGILRYHTGVSSHRIPECSLCAAADTLIGTFLTLAGCHITIRIWIEALHQKNI